MNALKTHDSALDFDWSGSVSDPITDSNGVVATDKGWVPTTSQCSNAKAAAVTCASLLSMESCPTGQIPDSTKNNSVVENGGHAVMAACCKALPPPPAFVEVLRDGKPGYCSPVKVPPNWCLDKKSNCGPCTHVGFPRV